MEHAFVMCALALIVKSCEKTNDGLRKIMHTAVPPDEWPVVTLCVEVVYSAVEFNSHSIPVDDLKWLRKICHRINARQLLLRYRNCNRLLCTSYQANAYCYM